MISKIAFLFLAVIAVLGMFGRWKMPGSAALKHIKRTQLDNRKCKRCGRYSIGRGPCGCGNGKA